MNKISSNAPRGASEAELALINKFTLKELKADDVFVFSVILCDNEIDRDGERFDDSALLKLKELFVGVTGIFDHAQSSKNQTARIFETEVISDKTKKTSYGGEYKFLKAKAYIPDTEKNRPLISDIASGIKKEVSVCCSVKEHICSVCGNDMRSEKCTHMKGAVYSGKLCHCILKDPADAYEWSFVAVPAQAGAGVIKSAEKTKVAKSFCDGENAFKKGDEIIISNALSKQLGQKLSELEKCAEEGKAYRRNLTKQAIKYSSLCLGKADGEIIKKMCDSLDIDSLKSFTESLISKASEAIPLKPQLEAREDAHDFNNNEFIF